MVGLFDCLLCFEITEVFLLWVYLVVCWVCCVCGFTVDSFGLVWLFGIDVVVGLFALLVVYNGLRLVCCGFDFGGFASACFVW